MAERDRFIDYLRGFAIILVIAVHVFYHKQFFPYVTLKSYILFEMPIIFFISGAGLFTSNHRDSSIGRFIPRRLKRLLLPYLILGLFNVALFYIVSIEQQSAVNLDHLVSWLLLKPENTTVIYISLYIWFVRTMLIVSFVHLVLVRLYARGLSRVAAGLILVGLLVLFSFFTDGPHGQLQSVAFYSIFVYIGYIYADAPKWASKRVVEIVLAISLVLLASLLIGGQFAFDMQANKFPPNLAYGLFGLSWLAVFLLCRNIFCRMVARLRLIENILTFYGTHSYSVYLWHGVGFWLIDKCVDFLGFQDRLAALHYAVPMALYLVVDLPLAALLALVAQKAETSATELAGIVWRRWKRPASLLEICRSKLLALGLRF